MTGQWYLYTNRQILRPHSGAPITAEYRDGVPEGEWTKPNRGPSPLLTLRVPQETLAALQALAASNGVPVSTLARAFILDGLARHEREDLRVALERLEQDLAAVKARALAS
jgi:predicted DNA binding CopG/RHH family protein